MAESTPHSLKDPVMLEIFVADQKVGTKVHFKEQGFATASLKLSNQIKSWPYFPLLGLVGSFLVIFRPDIVKNRRHSGFNLETKDPNFANFAISIAQREP